MNAIGGTATINGSELDHNQANGGVGNTGATEGTGAAFVNLGAGGGIASFLGSYDSSGYGTLDASVLRARGREMQAAFKSHRRVDLSKFVRIATIDRKAHRLAHRNFHLLGHINLAKFASIDLP
jgi:hypothetical protein